MANKVNTIESGNYCGYIWMSNKKMPEIINGNFTKLLDNTTNPFIIEGQLYDAEKGVSYSIKFVDGDYLILRFDVKKEDFNNKDNEIKEFYANRIEGHKKLCFLQYWRSKKDEMCCDMDVLEPAELVFVGFNDKEDEQ